MILRLPPNAQANDLLRLNEAIFRLSNNQDFNTILGWLKLEKERLSDDNMKMQDVQFKWNQGALQALSDILAMSDREAAAKILKTLKE